MPRVTDAEVKGILDTDIADTTPFILTANLIVNEVLATAGYSDERLYQIELWLSAHFACHMDARETSVDAGASASFEGKTDMGLNWSRYGQQAQLLDTSGLLTALGKVRGRVTVAPRVEMPLSPGDSTLNP